MRKLIKTILFLLAGSTMFGQEILKNTAPEFSIKSISAGTKLIVEIENKNTEVVEFLTLFHRKGSEYIFRSEIDYIKYLRSACNNLDTLSLECKLAIIEAEATIYKQDLFINAISPFSLLQRSENSTAYIKLNSIIGSKLGMYSKQSIDYSNSAYTDLLYTGLLKQNEFRILSSDYHSFTEILLNKKWAIVDFDPSLPMLYSKSKLGHDQLQKVKWEVFQSEITFYNFNNVHGDFIKRYDKGDLRPYQKLLTENVRILDEEELKSESYKIDGYIKLPASAKILIEYEEKFFRVDTTENKGAKLYDEVMQRNQKYDDLSDQGNKNEAEKEIKIIISLLSEYFNVSKTDMKKILESGEITIGSSKWIPHYPKEKAPSIKIILPKRDTAYEIGKDIMFPGLVLEVELQNGDYVNLWNLDENNDAITINKNFESMLWKELNDQTSTIENNQIQYLKNGTISAKHGPVTLTISYNPMILNFLWGELSLELANGMKGLQINRYLNGEPIKR
jgi:hypothetical protein